MKFEDITPVPSSEKRKTKKMYFNPKTGEYVTYAKAYQLKKKGIDLFQNEVEIPNEYINQLPILEERLKFINATLEMLQKITNE